jgi:hypothetical protein
MSISRLPMRLFDTRALALLELARHVDHIALVVGDTLALVEYGAIIASPGFLGEGYAGIRMHLCTGMFHRN